MRIIFPDPKAMEALNYPKLAYCPFLIDIVDSSYPPEPNQYLRERALSEWIPRLGQSSVRKGQARVLTVKSRETIARRICEFLRWCRAKNKDWRNIDYLNDLLGEWQPSLLDGTASFSKKKLCASTVNAFIGEAVYFLTWAADRGYRNSFDVLLNKAHISISKGNNSRSVEQKEIDTRVGAVRLPPQRVILPTDKQVEKWLRQVYLLRGPVKALACETIIRTGLRISECNQLLVTDIPKKIDGQWRKEWLDSGEVPVLVHRGNKGPKTSSGSLESTQPRQVYLPIDLADRIDKYINEGRSTLMMRAIYSIKDKALRERRMREVKPSRLWIGEKSGLPFTNHMLYKSWKNVPACPEGWHPHEGRSFFAVETIVRYMQDMMEHYKITEIGRVGWLDGIMLGQIRIILSPLLGHVSDSTTQLYLRGAKQRLIELFGHPAISWNAICDGEMEDFDD